MHLPITKIQQYHKLKENRMFPCQILMRRLNSHNNSSKKRVKAERINSRINKIIIIKINKKNKEKENKINKKTPRKKLRLNMILMNVISQFLILSKG